MAGCFLGLGWQVLAPGRATQSMYMYAHTPLIAPLSSGPHAQLLAEAKHQELAMLLWALVRLGVQPPQPWLEACLAACQHHMAAVGGQAWSGAAGAPAAATAVEAAAGGADLGDSQQLPQQLAGDARAGAASQQGYSTSSGDGSPSSTAAPSSLSASAASAASSSASGGATSSSSSGQAAADAAALSAAAAARMAAAAAAAPSSAEEPVNLLSTATYVWALQQLGYVPSVEWLATARRAAARALATDETPPTPARREHLARSISASLTWADAQHAAVSVVGTYKVPGRRLMARLGDAATATAVAATGIAAAVAATAQGLLH